MEDKVSGILPKIDRYFRSEDTTIAKALKKVSPKTGQEYRESQQKQIAEIVIATPLAVGTLPLMGALVAAKKLEDGESAFYSQKRISKNGIVNVIKIRCMRQDVDSDVQSNLQNALSFGESEDPRNTKLGKFMRKHNLEEIPQLWQIIKGDLSLVELRAAPQYVIDYLKEKDPVNFEKWENAYMSASKPGVFGLNAAVNPNEKDDLKRHHYDLLYSRKASLGLDLYILYRTGARMLEKLRKKVGNK